MAKIAQGIITLSSVNDAFTVSLSPNSCVINAKWNGEAPDYSNAFADLTVCRGEVAMPFEIIDVSTINIGNCDTEDLANHVKRIRITQIVNGALSGKVSFQIKCGDDFTTWINLPFTVVRETSMLDWILDWEGREKTEIAGEHIITPKIFVGKSANGGQLTGTYIGPAFDGSEKVGVFGYSAGKEIFHLDNTGGMIGGWLIEDGGIQTSDGALKILSEGTIISTPGGVKSWELNKDGTATFAGGDVILAKNVSVFKGEIQAAKGTIGGWMIGSNSLYHSAILLNATERYIGIRNMRADFIGEPTKTAFINDIKTYGGIAAFFESNNSFGIEGWTPATTESAVKVFSLGSNNMIAGWRFDNEAIWSGEDVYSSHSNAWIYAKVNTEGRFTSISDAITIGSHGIRGNQWRLESDGSGALAGGKIWWDANGYCEFQGTLQAATIIGSSITGGTIQAVDYIKSESGTWQLNKDGSGNLANGNVQWGIDGHVKVSGGLKADTFELAICQTMANGYIDGSTGSFISPDTGDSATLILPELNPNCARIFHLMVPSNNKLFKIGFADTNVTFTIPGQEEVAGANNNNPFDEDGFVTIDYFGGQWCELVGIKLPTAKYNALITNWNNIYATTHFWDGVELQPISAVPSTQAQVASIATYKTHWFMIPKSSKLHWFVMAMMGLTL